LLRVRIGPERLDRRHPELHFGATNRMLPLREIEMQIRKCWNQSLTAFVCLGLLLTATALAQAQSSPPEAAPSALDRAMNTLSSTKRFEQVAISPNGQKVAWVEAAGAGKTAILIDRSTGGAAKPISASASGPADEEAVAWAPDSARIAFLSDADKPGQLQLYVADSSGGTPRKLTNVTGFLASPGWLPDGRTIAVLFTENATRAAGPLVAETPQTGEIKEAVTEQRLALVDVGTGEVRQISPPDTYIYEYDWSPDGKRFAVIAARGNGDNNWYIAQLYTLDATGGAMKSIYTPPLQIANPAWSPDGETIAFIGGLMSDEPSVGGDVYTISIKGGDGRNLTPEMKASASWLQWTKDGELVVGQIAGGDAAVATVDRKSGTLKTLWRGPEEITAQAWGTNLSISRDGKSSAAIRSSFSHPPEIWVGPIGQWKQITQHNRDIKPAWGEAKSLHWNSDGYDVQGWLLSPVNIDPTKKYPMVVQVHGGPGAAVQSYWPSSQNFAPALVASGYFVLEANPRGSFGQGEAFTRANVKDFGYGDFRDILAGVDEALRVAPIDPQRLGLTGWSYGGFMTMWGVTQTNRFRAAMAGAGIADWQSYYGENLIDQWMIPFFGASVYDDPAVYAKSSPITFIKNVKTPTLIQVGDSDGECPSPQSYEFWHALKTLGVETQFVVYEHEGHMFANPEHRREVVERTVKWFDAHLK
jgi:dipeptidyl aminopeptidase/acylaminoacyl peptidase